MRLTKPTAVAVDDAWCDDDAAHVVLGRAADPGVSGSRQEVRAGGRTGVVSVRSLPSPWVQMPLVCR